MLLFFGKTSVFTTGWFPTTYEMLVFCRFSSLSERFSVDGAKRNAIFWKFTTAFNVGNWSVFQRAKLLITLVCLHHPSPLLPGGATGRRTLFGDGRDYKWTPSSISTRPQYVAGLEAEELFPCAGGRAEAFSSSQKFFMSFYNHHNVCFDFFL